MEKILLLTLETFRAAGGIQSMNRALANSLQGLSVKHNWIFDLYAYCDRKADLDARYLPKKSFSAFDKHKVKFVVQSIKKGLKADLIILTHINLSAIAWVIYLLNPKCRIWLVAHGVEVWRPLKLWKKSIWNICEHIICVSRFTQHKVIALHQASTDRCVVVNNILDPFLTLPESFYKPDHLLKRYQVKTTQKVIFTLTRISASEQFKGYDQVIRAISQLRKKRNDIKYILAGPYDEAEKERILQLVSDHDLNDNFLLTGYIDDQDLADHFLLADVFVLPSKKEGFGIVFIEAMAFGLPVICGNADGSIDAVRNPQMGTTVDPDDLEALEKAITQQLDRVLTIETRKGIQEQCLKYFNQELYMQTLERLIKNGTAS
ncbi:glycosyltransferase family 4 protein [Pedobacter heparinus]|uniref:glycosyltransferase family 4 protein n=1 Tax=Pedobacter heparinus TaxID=984 RepID=UPI002930B9BC|nr:glycosyltransferase family 4 protein [Pedobacter heparinus]